MALPDPMPVTPLEGPLDVVVQLPGSKSLTNRALVCAALAEGPSVLEGALEADDTVAMVEGLRSLGVAVEADWPTARLEVTGVAGRPLADAAVVDARLSGTTSRFLLPVAALGEGLRRVDGANRMRERPMAEAIDALRALGAEVDDVGAPGHLPVDLVGGTLAGGEVAVRGDVSSQFLSGLLLAAPAMPTGLVVHVIGPLVSQPYVDMTVAVMAAFGAAVDRPDERTWVVEPQRYLGTTYVIEPDASAASYAFAAAALLGGSVTVEGLGGSSLQGDVAFVDLLEQMGVTVERGDHRTTVSSTGRLRGIEADLADISDTAQTLAVVAAFAEGPTRVRGIGFIRGKETDRVRAVVTELRRLGIDADEEPDGFVVRPGPIRPATVHTYDDHRMAMAFALVGLRVSGVQIADPSCVGKTFPGYWAFLDELRAPSPTGAMVHPS
jgi:3-phosphoshikimate 1-carboxyvinyltransferase